MDEETNPSIMLYGISAVGQRFVMNKVPARFVTKDMSYGERSSMDIYETLEDTDYFGSKGRQWADDGSVATITPGKVIEAYLKTRKREMNRVMDRLQVELKYLQSLEEMKKEYVQEKT